MSSGIGFFLMIVMMLGGGPNGPSDLLDLMPTEAYWQSKGVTPSVEQLEKDAGPEKGAGDVSKLIAGLGSDDFKVREGAAKELEGMGAAVLPQLKPALESKDPEVVSAAEGLSKKLSAHAKARDVRRLMAIRTLGEVKAKGSVATLKLLLDSKELFVSEYAARAIAQIEGKPLPKVERKALTEDLKLVPKDVGILGQFNGMAGTPVTVERIAEVVGAQMRERAQGMGLKEGDVPDQKKLAAMIVAKVLEVAEEVGNVRADGMTMAMSSDAFSDTGWVMMVFHGKGDAAAFIAALAKTETRKGPGMEAPAVKKTKDGDITIIEADPFSTFIVPSNEQLIMVGGPSAENNKKAMENVMALVKGGKESLEKNEEISGLMNKVDVKGPFWAVGKLNAEMQKEQVFEGIDTFTLTSKQGKESVSFTLSGQGTDAEKLKTSAETMSGFVKSSIEAGKPEVEKVKELGAVMELLESLKFTSDAKTATMTGEAKPGVVHFVVSEGPLSWMLMEEIRRGTELMQDAPEGAPGRK